MTKWWSRLVKACAAFLRISPEPAPNTMFSGSQPCFSARARVRSLMLGCELKG